MADVSSQATLLRGGRFRFTGRLNTIPRTVKFSRFVNMASVPNPLFAITFDGSGTGAYTDVRVGMTVVVYHQNTDTVKGFLRVAYGGSTSTVLQVNEVSKGTVDVRDNDRFEVIEEWDIWDVLVSASATFDKDSRRAYVDEGVTPPPVANSGGPVVGDIDPATGALLTNFFGDTSFVVAASGSLTHAWDFGSDATPPTSTSTNPATVSIPEGFRFALHTVTANGKSDVERVPVFANGPNYPALPVRMRSRRYTTLGWTATFEVPIWAADIAVLRERGFIVYSETEQRGTVTGSFGSNVANRSHVKFAGYLDRTSIRVSADETTISFDAISPLAVLQKTGALPQLLSRSGTGWTRLNDLNFWRALWYLLYWGSTAKLSHDFLWPDGQSYAYAALAVDNDTSIQGQLQDIGSSIKVEITCDMLGRLLCVRNPNYLSISERAARTKMYTFGNADFISADLELEHRLQYKFVRGEALTPAATVAGQSAVYSDAPGPAPGPGTQTATLTKQIATQDELNARTGDELAALNGTYYDETTRSTKRVPKGVSISLPDGYDVFDPAYREFVALPLDTGRYVYDASTRWLVDELSISYDEDGSKEITATVSHETHGAAGKTGAAPVQTPTEYQLPDPDLSVPGNGEYEPPLNGSLSRAAPYLYAPDALNHCVWKWTRETALWEVAVDLGDVDGEALDGTLVDATWRVGGNIMRLVTTTEVRRLSNYSSGTPALGTPHTLPSSTLRRQMQFERGLPDFGLIASYTAENGVEISRTLDDLTWTDTVVTAFADPNPADNLIWTPGLYLFPFQPGKAWITVFTSNVPTAAFYETSDYAASWHVLSSPSADPGNYLSGAICVPFGGSGSPVYYAGRVTSGGFEEGRLFRTIGATTTDISPQDSAGFRYGPEGATPALRAIAIADDDPESLLVVGVNPSTSKGGVWLTRKASSAVSGTSDWIEIVAPYVGMPIRSLYFVDRNSAYAVGDNGTVAFIDLLNNTFFDLSIPGGGRIPALMGG